MITNYQYKFRTSDSLNVFSKSYMKVPLIFVDTKAFIEFNGLKKYSHSIIIRNHLTHKTI